MTEKQIEFGQDILSFMKMKFLVNKVFEKILQEAVGKHAILYHGTDNKQFEKFQFTSSKRYAAAWDEGSSVTVPGIFFTDSIREAKTYGSHVAKCRVNLGKMLFGKNDDIDFMQDEKIDDIANIFSTCLTCDRPDDKENPGRFFLSKIGSCHIIGWLESDKEIERGIPDADRWIQYLFCKDGGVFWEYLEMSGVIEKMKALGYNSTMVAENNGTYKNYSYFVCNPEQIEIIEWM